MPADSTIVEALRANLGAGDPDLAGKLVLACEIDRTLVSDGSLATLRAATTEYATQPGDTPSSAPFEARMILPSFGQSILDSDWLHSASSELRSLLLINLDGELDAEVDPAVYSLEGADLRLLGGLVGWSYSQLVPLPGGSSRVLDVRRGSDVIELILQGDAERLDQPVQRDTFSGFGYAYDFAGTAKSTIGDLYNLGLRDFSLEVVFQVGTVSADRVLWDKRGSLSGSAGTPGHVGYFDSSGQLRVLLDDGSNIANLAIGSAHEFDDDERHTLALSADRNDAAEATGYVDGVEELAATDISAVTGRISTSAVYYHGALSGSSAFFSGVIDEPRIYWKALTAKEVESRWNRSLDGTEAGLVGLWRYDEDTGPAAKNDVRGPNLVQPVLTGTQHCSMGTTAGDPGSGSATLCTWGRVAEGDGGVLASRKNSAASGDAGIAVYFDSGQLIVEVSDGATQVQVALGADLDDDTPYGVALVIDTVADELRGYLLDYPRGTVVAGTPVSIAALGTIGGGSVDFRIGAYAGGTGHLTGSPSWASYVDAALDEDEVRLALSDQWVEDDDDAPTPPPKLLRILGQSAAAHFWGLFEGSGTVAGDSIGGASGTWNSAPTRRTRHGTITPGASGDWIGTLEGTIDLRGLPKPVALGRPRQLEPVLVDPHRGVYLYSDPALAATQEVEEVRVEGAILDPSEYAVDLTSSTITADYSQILTCSVKGVVDPVSGEWLQYPGELVRFVWQEVMGLTAVDDDSISAYDDLHPFTAELWLGPCDQSLETIYHRLLPPDGYAYKDLSGDLALGTRRRPGTGTPALTLKARHIVSDSAEQVATPPPTWYARVAYGKVTATLRSFVPGVGAGDQYDSAQTYRYVEDRRVEVLEAHPGAIIRTYDAAIRKRPDAAILVQRMLDLDGEVLPGWSAGLTIDHWYLDLGDEVVIEEYSRYDVAGKRYIVVGYDYGIEQGMPVSIVTLWGGIET